MYFYLVVASNNYQCQDNQQTFPKGTYIFTAFYIYMIITKLLLLPAATTTVNLLFNGSVVANGIAVEGSMLHGKEIPSLFQKVAVTGVHKRTKLLFKTSFDDNDYINAGEVIAWPSSLMQSS